MKSSEATRCDDVRHGFHTSEGRQQNKHGWLYSVCKTESADERFFSQERRTTILEHHLFEKTFVVETRLVGERPLPGDPRVRSEVSLTALGS